MKRPVSVPRRASSTTSEGDGKIDAIETFALFASDPVPTSWESYSSGKHKFDAALSRGQLRDFENGTVRFEFWKCFGKGPVQLKLADCRVSLPFSGGEDKTLGRSGEEEKERATVGAEDKPPGAARIFYAQGAVLGLTLNGGHFGIFGPTGSNWGEVAAGESTDSIVSDLAGKDYLSVAVLA